MLKKYAPKEYYRPSCIQTITVLRYKINPFVRV